jgi:hypothetical protein
MRKQQENMNNPRNMNQNNVSMQSQFDQVFIGFYYLSYS